MKNILFAMMAMLLLSVGMVSAVYQDPCNPLNPAIVTGTVYDQSNAVVPNANVMVTCDTQTGYATTDANGAYYMCFDADVCGYNDELYAEASTETASGSNTGEMCDEKECFMPIGIVNITIPEFGVIAGGIALIGALGIFMYRRK
jgi:hypothetical protein